MSEATQEHFSHIHMDVGYMVATFTYSDEMQDEAKEKQRNLEMALAIIAALAIVATAFTGWANVASGPLEGALGTTTRLGRSLSKFTRPLKSLTKVNGKLGKLGKKMKTWNSPQNLKKVTSAVKSFDGKCSRDHTTTQANVKGLTGAMASSFLGLKGLALEIMKLDHNDNT